MALLPAHIWFEDHIWFANTIDTLLMRNNKEREPSSLDSGILKDEVSTASETVQ